MGFVTRIASSAALSAAVLSGVGLTASPARATFIVTLAQVDNNVVATGRGTIDTTDLTQFGGVSSAGPLMVPGTVFLARAVMYVGPLAYVTDYSGLTGPNAFGNGGETLATSGSGDATGVNGGAHSLFVPLGYVSGNLLLDITTWDNASFASLGVTPGTYVWTWGSGKHADSFKLEIPTTSVPEPSSVLVLALPLGVLVLLGARRRRAARNAGSG